ncbi:MAG: hypothetical protein K2M03_03675 [Muribaculaceae bacterium]|nr:hypothetical protein [Muribaculaceae bacterium]MDE6295142.1 hypothetical protein [Muribaculaceae bacterium]
MDTIGDKKLVNEFEEKVRQDLVRFLQDKGALDAHVPECPDVEERWAEIARAYLPDGAREFQKYPVVSLGWIMFIGMAMAYYWDTDWEKYSKETGLYEAIRDRKGYDMIDEVVVQDILGYKDEAAEKVTELVAECASRVDSLLRHEQVEPGTQTAFGCYIAALHQLYLVGMAMQLNALGYHMTPYGGAN